MQQQVRFPELAGIVQHAGKHDASERLQQLVDKETDGDDQDVPQKVALIGAQSPGPFVHGHIPPDRVALEQSKESFVPHYGPSDRIRLVHTLTFFFATKREEPACRSSFSDLLIGLYLRIGGVRLIQFDTGILQLRIKGAEHLFRIIT